MRNGSIANVRINLRRATVLVAEYFIDHEEAKTVRHGHGGESMTQG